MSSTCNTLPTPAEFDLLTANQFQSVRDVMTDLESETISVPNTPEERIALHLPEDRGRKLLNCRKNSISFKYPDGHRSWRPGFPCNMTICCLPCALDQAADQYSKYSGLSRLIRQRFTRLTIPITAADTDGTIKSSYDTLMKLLHRTIPKTPTLAKIKPSSDTVEIISTSTLPDSAIAKIRLAYPSAVVRLHYQSSFSRELHRVVDADQELFKSPELAALADSKYQKTCLLRTQGISREERSKLSLIDPIRDNLSESSPGAGSDAGSQPPKPPEKLYHRTASGRLMPVPACPCGCGSAPTHFACSKSQHEAIPEEDWIPIQIVTETQRLMEIDQLNQLIT